VNGATLLVCDVQTDLVDPKDKVGADGLAKIVAERNLLSNLKTLIASVRGKGWPVVYIGLSSREHYQDVLSVAPRITKARESKVAVRGGCGAEFHPDIAPRAGDIVFYKQWINPVFGTPLLEWLRRNGVGNLLIAGTSTNLVVESAARYTDDAGFAVSVVEDCCASPNPAWHKFAVTQILPVFGKVITSKEIK
jgi:nicotinamidase-related amidase